MKINYLIVVYYRLTDSFKNEYFETKEEMEQRIKAIKKIGKRYAEVRRIFKVEEMN